MRVVIVQRERGRETVVGVRSARRGRVLFACVGVGERGTALAIIEAVAYCTRRGHTVVTPVPADALRALALPDGSLWMLPDEWLRGCSSAEVVARLHAMRRGVLATPVDAAQQVAAGEPA